MYERGRESIIGNKVRNEMASTSKCTLAKGNEKMKIIVRGVRSDILGCRAQRDLKEEKERREDVEERDSKGGDKE